MVEVHGRASVKNINMHRHAFVKNKNIKTWQRKNPPL